MVLTCLGRVYLLKGKQDKSIAAMKSSLDYSRRALAINPNSIHFKFNIAFVQIQLAQLMHALSESQRTLTEVQAAAQGLDDAIESLAEIAQSPNPPYPKHEIEQRANMGRNTMRKQLERDSQQQREYEEKNASRLEEARKTREAEMKRREEERKKAEVVAAEQKRKIAEERNQMLALSRELAEKRAEEERRKEELEYTTDEETGERVKRKKKPRATGGGKRKKKGEDSDTASESDNAASKATRRKKSAKASREDSPAAGTSGDDKPKKRRKLARRGAQHDKFKSSELVVDSDEDDEGTLQPTGAETNGKPTSPLDTDMSDAPPEAATPNGAGDSDEDEDAVASRPRKKPVRRIAESDDEDDDREEEKDASAPPAPTTAEMAAADAEGDEAGPKGNAFADAPELSMVDESVGAAGDKEAVELAAGALAYDGEKA